MTSRMSVVFHVTADSDTIERRAQAIAVEQSVEMPLAAISDQRIMTEIVGQVEDISDLGEGRYAVTVGLAVATTGLEPGQFLNMIYGNTSIQETVVLADADFPAEIFGAFGGPNHGVAGLRARIAEHDPSAAADAGPAGTSRPLTCSALKPQGFSVSQLADLAHRFALGGPDFIKDDHGLADQDYAPYDARVPAIAEAVQWAVNDTGRPVRYVPNLSGNLDRMRAQIRIARDVGLDTVMIAPMIAGFPTFQTLVKENPDFAFFSHPTMTGAQRIRPELLHGKLFRLMGADACIYTNYGGRFGFTRETCRALARNALRDWGGIKATIPVPAGGMTLDRVPEMMACYGGDVMLLIGGDLLLAGEKLPDETRQFVTAVATHAPPADALANA